MVCQPIVLGELIGSGFDPISGLGSGLSLVLVAVVHLGRIGMLPVLVTQPAQAWSLWLPLYLFFPGNSDLFPAGWVGPFFGRLSSVLGCWVRRACAVQGLRVILK